MGDNDWFGVFDSFGTWSVPNTSNLYPLNIIKPMIKANTAAAVSADVKVLIEPRVPKDTHAEMIADVSRCIRDLKTEEQWTHQLKEQVATESQVAPGVFIHVDWDADASNNFAMSVDEWAEDEWSDGGKAVCKSCGYETSVDTFLPDDNDEATVPCSNCGSEAEVVEKPQTGSVSVIKDTKKVRTGNTQTRVIPAGEIVIDDRHTAGGNIESARWIMHRHLEPIDELEAKYPESKGKMGGGAQMDWSYPLRWQYVMRTGNDQPYMMPGVWVDDNREVKDLYLTPQMYAGFVASSEFKVGTKFTVAAGKGFADAVYRGKKFDEEPVLCFRTVGQTIVDVFPCDFREKIIYVTFLSNPSSFWGLFLTEMLPLQNVVNYMNSIQVFHTRRNARTTKLLDSGYFNPEDLEKDVSLTKEPLLPGDDLRSHFAFVPSATLSPVPQEILQTQIALAPQIGGVTPAMTGQSQRNEPYAAQRQQKEQSLGQLVPFLRSIAFGQVQWTLRQLKEAQENWGEEDFLFLLKLNPDWTEEYIEAFMEADLDTDIVIDYEQGSESPRNLLDRELALQQFLQTLGTVGQISVMGSPIATPEVLNEVLLGIKRITQVDVDVKNTEAELRLADARSDKILKLTEGIEPPPGTPMEVLNLMASQLTSLPDLHPYPFEDHATESEFYADQIEKELSKDSPSHLKVACWYAMINAHKNAAVQYGQEQTEAQMAAQAPAMQAQAEMAGQQSQAEAQAQAQQQQSDQQAQLAAAQQKAQMDAQLAAQKQEFEGQRIQADQSHKAALQVSQQNHQFALDQANKAHELEKMRLEHEHQKHIAKTKPKAGK